MAPGKPLWLGLQIEHAPHWHTYWKNPGDSGLPTTLAWALPPGFASGERRGWFLDLPDPDTFGQRYELCGPKVYTLAELVRLAGQWSGHPRPVVPLPGANAAATALSASGFESGRFLFCGFLPARAAERRRLLARWDREVGAGNSSSAMRPRRSCSRAW